MEVHGSPEAGGSDGRQAYEASDEGAIEPRQQKWIEFDQRLNAVIESYDEYDDVLDYLKVVGCLMGV